MLWKKWFYDNLFLYKRGAHKLDKRVNHLLRHVFQYRNIAQNRKQKSVKSTIQKEEKYVGNPLAYKKEKANKTVRDIICLFL